MASDPGQPTLAGFPRCAQAARIPSL